MKQTKKIIAALAAATMVASCAGVVASAAEAVNAVNVSYSTVAETFTAADGTVIPAGATAVTLSIENNTGFSASDITLSATADLLGTDGLVTATNGSAYGNATVSAAQNGSKVVITSASLDDSKNDGTLVTFYTTSDAEVTVEDAAFKSAKQMEDASAIAVCSSDDYYRIGDLNNDDNIDSTDMYYQLNAYRIAENDPSLITVERKGLTYAGLSTIVANKHKAKYGLIEDAYAMAGDGNNDRVIAYDKEQLIISDVDNLAYYVARRGAGYTTDLNRYDFHYGEYVFL
ncbi:MAG TPA: hypothetical protein OIM05_02850 [Oscillospiraceae bacterium]|uniref:hypothetical protein n=1 Tax=uncultured Ruminococcus sp. TaxID=165186 RepID=UPI0025980CA6|nr:hypothetical protein [uncultured Ruminococcus sp.]HJH91909.1 hypothetical protein [Oscillospiraceae bacterium]